MLLAIILLIILLVAGAGIVGGLSGAVWVPAASADIAAAIKVLDLKAGTRVIEFGCGDGRFLRQAATRGAAALGYEINPFLWALARVLCRSKNIEVKRGDAWNKSFQPADVVFAFLMPRFMERLGAKLAQELRPDTIAVTYIFPIPGREHYHYEKNCYFYRF